jgi:hypothetical protein
MELLIASSWKEQPQKALQAPGHLHRRPLTLTLCIPQAQGSPPSLTRTRPAKTLEDFLKREIHSLPHRILSPCTFNGENTNEFYHLTRH